MTDTRINEPTQVIAAAYPRWKRARDFIAGEDAVKAGNYLARNTGQSPLEYQNMVDRTAFFAGAARTHECMVGLVTRKAASLECDDDLKPVFETVTMDGRGVDDLGEEGFEEVMQTGLWGILVDHPLPAGKLRSVLEAERNLVTAGIATYAAENILEITPGIANNRRTTVRVRLLEDEGKTVRELILDEGVYRYIIHREVQGTWYADAPVTPLRDGSPLTQIPFYHSDPKGGVYKMVAGPLDHVIRTNLQHFKEECNAANSRFWSATPVPYIKGAEADPNLLFAPGNLLWFPYHTREHPVDTGFMEWNGSGQAALQQACNDRKDEMAKLGSNILASEKSAVEAAETHAIRRSSENSVLAGLARSVSRKIEEALRFVAYWNGMDEKAAKAIKFNLNTDFVPSPMTAQEIKVVLELWQASAISRDQMWTMLQEGEVLNETFDREVEASLIDNEVANLDRPAIEPVLEPAE